MVYECVPGYQAKLLAAYRSEDDAAARVRKEREKARVFGTNGEYFYQETELKV